MVTHCVSEYIESHVTAHVVLPFSFTADHSTVYHLSWPVFYRLWGNAQCKNIGPYTLWGRGTWHISLDSSSVSCLMCTSICREFVQMNIPPQLQQIIINFQGVSGHNSVYLQRAKHFMSKLSNMNLPSSQPGACALTFEVDTILGYGLVCSGTIIIG